MNETPGSLVAAATAAHPLKALRLGVETQHETVAFMHVDCPVGRSEGVAARAQVELIVEGRSALATLYLVRGDFLGIDEVGLSEVAWRRLGCPEGSPVQVRHARQLESMSAVRSKVYGHQLGDSQLAAIVGDVVAERYTDVQLATFLTAFAAQPPQLAETVALTRAMLEAGDRLSWPGEKIADKHSVGGLPANRTTPIIVAIAAAAGLTIPKTSSRAITSPAGTADTMETMAPVDLDVPAMRRVVEREGGCIVWGGSVRLSPADDIFIRVERALDLDSEAQLVASVISKKLAAGSTHVLLDLPVGPTAKVRTAADAERLSAQLMAVAAELGMVARPLFSDGTQPVGTGIGPSLEAEDVLAVLRCDKGAPADLRQRAIHLAGALLELAGACPEGAGEAEATGILDDGRAIAKFYAICEAQGGFREPGVAPLTHSLVAETRGIVTAIDNRVVARIAKLAGAPRAKTAGLELHAKLGDRVEPGQPLMTLYGESRGEMDYALAYAAANPDAIAVRPR